jgi:gamma-glutamyltranspeptidase
LPDRIAVERGGFPDSILAGLRALGHEVMDRNPMGDVEAIIRTARGWKGVSDPRRGGGPAGY